MMFLVLLIGSITSGMCNGDHSPGKNHQNVIVIDKATSHILTSTVTNNLTYSYVIIKLSEVNKLRTFNNLGTPERAKLDVLAAYLDNLSWEVTNKEMTKLSADNIIMGDTTPLKCYSAAEFSTYNLQATKTNNKLLSCQISNSKIKRGVYRQWKILYSDWNKIY